MEKPTGFQNVIDLPIARATLQAPTQLFAMLLRRSGNRVTITSPGCIEVEHPDSGHRTIIRVRPVNIYTLEAEAYTLADEPVPPRVLHDIEQWERDHGRRP